MRKPAMVLGLLLIPSVAGVALVAHQWKDSKETEDPSDLPGQLPVTTIPQATQHSTADGSVEQSPSSSPTGPQKDSNSEEPKESAPSAESFEIDEEETLGEPMLAHTSGKHESRHSFMHASAMSDLSFRGAGGASTQSRSAGAAGSGAFRRDNAVDNADAEDRFIESFLDSNGSTPVDSLPSTDETHRRNLVKESGDAGEPADELRDPLLSSDEDLHDSGQRGSDDRFADADGGMDELFLGKGSSDDLGRHEPVTVPEPGPLALLGLGLVGCALIRRKKK